MMRTITTLRLLAIVAVVAAITTEEVSGAAFFPSSGVVARRSASSSHHRTAAAASSTRRFQVSSGKEGDNGSNKDGDFVPDEELLFPQEDPSPSSSGVDWDAEWKKVVEKQKQSGAASTEKRRPGEGYYKTEAEIRAIKAANKATSKMNEVQANMANSMPSWDSLKGDWKFWIGLLLVLSFGSSLLAAVSSGPGVIYDQPPPPASNGGSYYI